MNLFFQITTVMFEIAVAFVAFELVKNQREMMALLKQKNSRKSYVSRRKRPARSVIVKKTHEREIVRVTPTSSEFMQQQYKRVAEQYANK